MNLEGYQKERVKRNIFPKAWDWVETQETFRWHEGADKKCDSWKPHSSQALAIDFFGTLAQATPGSRNNILNTLARLSRLDDGENWTVDVEWVDNNNPMNENAEHPTQFDAIARSEKTALFVECKFAERTFKPCSQVEPLTRGSSQGLIQCNGNFAIQTNPLNGKESRCALSGKGIRYWSIIPSIFGISNCDDHIPCPFAGAEYQTMRNLVNGTATARRLVLRPAFLVVFAEAERFAMSKYFKSKKWNEFVGSIDDTMIPISSLTYQSLCSIAVCQCDEEDKSDWLALSDWILKKISRVVSARP